MGKVIPYLEEHAFLERVDTLYDPIYISSPVELAYTHPILGGFLYGPEEAERRLKVMEKSNPVKRSPSGDVETEYRHFAQGLRQ